MYTGVVQRIHEKAPQQYQPKPLLDVLDPAPVFTDYQFQFISWISTYYMCSLGDAYSAVLPSGMKLSSDSYLSLQTDLDFEEIALSEKEEWVIQALKDSELQLNDIRQLTGLKHPYRIIKSLSDKNVIQVHEKIKDKYKPKKERRIRLTPQFSEEDSLDILAESLQHKVKQIEVLETYLNLVPVLEDPDANEKGVLKSILISEGVSSSSLKTLVKNHVLEEWDEIIDRFQVGVKEHVSIELTSVQKLAFEKVNTQMTQHTTTLLKGVTGSGKTEIYVSLIQEIIDQGKRALFLLPEIALTTQIISRLRKIFGNRFGIYHSRFSDNERVEIYQKCLDGAFDFIVGVRSSVFLPIQDLGLVVVDEEHEPSYKQYDPAPRYHARDAAIYLAHLHGAKVVLGSATPSLESYLNAQEGKYGFVELTERYLDQPLPDIKLVDMSRERKQRTIKGVFSSELIQAIEQTISKGKQVILFQNRRGYSPFVQCDNCQHIPKCPNCSVSLTYHIYQNQLICHYCGYKEFMVAECPSCGSQDIRTIGSGTEKIQEELEILLPNLQVKRMDLDTTRSKHAYQQIIDDFEQGNIDVLIGTQMVTKGLDFEHVDLVGIFDADRLIHFPDFRSHERAFQLMTQVSGRSGRKHDRGLVLIQTSDPQTELLRQIQHHDTEAFYPVESRERESFKYPPFYRMIRVIIRNKDKLKAYQAAFEYHRWATKEIGQQRVLGPVEPMIGKIRNLYIYEIIIKAERQGISLSALKEFLLSSRDTLLALPSFKSVLVHFDVDPV